MTEGAHGQKRPSVKVTLRPREEWIPISVPTIIDLESFHQASIRSKDNQKFSPRNLQEMAYLLRKLVRCGQCGLSCFARTMNQMKGRPKHYYICSSVNGFFRQERCSQRVIGADALDELVWQEVSTRLQDPGLVLEAYRRDRSHRRDHEEAGSSEPAQRLATQIKLANTEMSRLVDAYQAGAIELPELQKRRRLVEVKLNTLNREKELLEKMALEQRQEGDVRGDLEEFAALIANRLQHFSFEDKQRLLRMVLDKVVIKDWRVDVLYTIPLPRPSQPAQQKVSTNFDLCRTRMAPRARVPSRRESAASHPASLDARFQSAAAVRLSSARSLPPTEGSYRYHPAHRRGHAARGGHSARAHSLGDFPAQHELTPRRSRALWAARTHRPPRCPPLAWPGRKLTRHKLKQLLR